MTDYGEPDFNDDIPRSTEPDDLVGVDRADLAEAALIVRASRHSDLADRLHAAEQASRPAPGNPLRDVTKNWRLVALDTHDPVLRTALVACADDLDNRLGIFE